MILVSSENGIEVTTAVAPPKTYEAWLYLIKIWKTNNLFKLYGGYHKGIFDPNGDNYFHSSEDIVMRHDFAWSDRIEYQILNYGTAGDMGYEEIKMLTKENAAKSKKWFNNTNGGGKYGKGYKGMAAVNELWNSINWVTDNSLAGDAEAIQKYADLLPWALEYATREFLKEIISRPNIYQAREVQIKAAAVILYRDIFNNRSTKPNEWLPLVFLMPKKGTDDLPFILGGNLRGHGCAGSKHGDGLFYIPIPYEVWQKILKEGGISNLKRVGSRLNKRSEIESERISEEESAVWTLGHCKENELYKKNSKGIEVLDIYHASISDELTEQGWKTNTQKRKIRKLAQSKFENEQNPDDSLVDFSDAGLVAQPKLKKEYYKRVKTYLKEYDLVYKISGSMLSAQKIIKQIHTNNPQANNNKKGGFKKKVLVLPYFENREVRQTYFDSTPTKHGTLTGREEFLNVIKYHFTENEIVIKELPVTVNEAEAEGWYDTEKEDQNSDAK